MRSLIHDQLVPQLKSSTPAAFIQEYDITKKQYEFLLQPVQEYIVAQYEEFGFFIATRMKDDYSNNLSLPHRYISWENVLSF